MALQIRDSHIDAMVSELQSLTKARTKTEVVRRALQHDLLEFALHCMGLKLCN
ncbi:type II toxin-antitoxin system VapB family antitoxin [Phyllobacterium bourgognense]|uniref:type II toxin-antitoxin system VapB family antitoxin n=1 Tax=Phyllobacterium bourgognense TaxID=314236 RepID=UPI000DF38EF1|nr:type II toxin-antitoxin system VapB family antitoxin [Phyllobacterium bourgognense]